MPPPTAIIANSPNTTAVGAARTWLAGLKKAYGAAYLNFVNSQPAWLKGASTWADDALAGQNGNATLTEVSDSLANAVEAGQTLADGAKLVTDPSTGLASLNIDTQADAVSSLLATLLAASSPADGGAPPKTLQSQQSPGVSFTITPSPPAPGTNVLADAQAQLVAFQQAMASGGINAALPHLNALAGDLQALTSTSGGGLTVAASPGVSKGAATGYAVAGVAAGGLVGGLLVHGFHIGMFSGAGETGASESRRNRKKKRA